MDTSTSTTSGPATIVATNVFSERLKKAFEFASDSTKQLITLATGIVTITITFAKDILTGVPTSLKVLLGAAWLIYLLSILGGVATLLALTGTLEPMSNVASQTNASIRGANVTRPSLLQIGAFLVATFCIIIFAIGGSWKTAATVGTNVPSISGVAQAEFSVITPTANLPADGRLRLCADGRYFWSASGKTHEGTFFYDASNGALRFSGVLAVFPQTRLLPDRKIVIQLRGAQGALSCTRWMCPFWPFCANRNRLDATFA